MLNKRLDKSARDPKRFLVKGKEYIVESEISTGLSSNIFKVVEKDSNKCFALKMKQWWTEDMGDQIMNEIYVLKELEANENIACLIGYEYPYLKNGVGVLVTELCSEGNLKQYLSTNTYPLPENEILSYLDQLIKAIAPLHKRTLPISHRDIRPEKILKFGNNIKLCDLGACSTLTLEPKLVDMKTKIKSMMKIERNCAFEYRPPEMKIVLSELNINEKVDIWMIGCCLYYMMYRSQPFEGREMKDLKQIYYPMPHSIYSEKLLDLTRLLLTPKPEQRPDIYQVEDILKDFKDCDALITLSQEVQTIKQRQLSENDSAIKIILSEAKTLETKIDSNDNRVIQPSDVSFSSISKFSSLEERKESSLSFTGNKVEETKEIFSNTNGSVPDERKHITNITPFYFTCNKSKESQSLELSLSTKQRIEEWNDNKDTFKKNVILGSASKLSEMFKFSDKSKNTADIWLDNKDHYKRNVYKSEDNSLSPFVSKLGSFKGKDCSIEPLRGINFDISEKSDEKSDSLGKSGSEIFINHPDDKKTIVISGKSKNNVFLNLNLGGEKNLKLNIQLEESSSDNYRKPRRERYKKFLNRDNLKQNERYNENEDNLEPKSKKAVKRASINSPRDKMKKPIYDNDSD